MGNCQAAEAATVVIQRSGGRVERIYWSLSANEVMASHPGHYVAVVNPAISLSGKPVKRLRLLRPDDTLHIGRVYRLLSFEDILKELAGKKCPRVNQLIFAPGGSSRVTDDASEGRCRSLVGKENSIKAEEEAACQLGDTRRGGSSGARQRQWKPALQSIAECTAGAAL